jgi:hypothetical protein
MALCMFLPHIPNVIALQGYYFNRYWDVSWGIKIDAVAPNKAFRRVVRGTGCQISVGTTQVYEMLKPELFVYRNLKFRHAHQRLS